MQRDQLINNLCTLNNIKCSVYKKNKNKRDSIASSLKLLTKNNPLLIIDAIKSKYILLKKDEVYIFGPFKKYDLSVIDNAKLLFFLFTGTPYNKDTVKIVSENVESIEIEGKERIAKAEHINVSYFLEESVKTGDIESIKLYIKVMFISLAAKDSDTRDFRLQKNLIIYIFSYIFNLIDDNNIDPDFNIFLTTIITSEFEFCENSSQLLFKTYQLIDKISDSFDFTSKKTDQRIKEAKFFITNNLDKKLTLERVALEMGISAKYLSNLFFEVTNTTFKEYVNMQRIAKAINLLAYSEKTLSDISKEVGIKSTNNFISFFKKYTSTTPTTYREGIKTD